MTRLASTQGRILDALNAQAGIEASTTDRFTAPCVIVRPGEPWSEPGTTSRVRGSRWLLTIVAGRADQGATLETLSDLVDRVDTALRTVDGAQLPTWSAPADLTRGGITYAVSTGSIELRTEEG